VEKTLDFQGLANELLRDAEALVSEWLPGGKRSGAEYVCADLSGGPGRSLSVNLSSGQWADFANADAKGGDLISLYAAIRNIGQGEAFKELSGDRGPLPGGEREDRSSPPPKDELQLGAPPDGAPALRVPGAPSRVYEYRDTGGAPLCYIARYDEDGGKRFCPWTWSNTKGEWVPKAYPKPRPLYGLELLAARPDAPVIIVEGEKAADAAREIAGEHYVVLTWPGGSKAWHNADFKVLKNRRIVLWPDADDAGVECMDELAKDLIRRKLVDVIKGVDVEGLDDNWDAADALASGWDWQQFLSWVRPRVFEIRQMEKAKPKTKEEKAEKKKELKSVHQLWDELGLEMGSQGGPVKNILNATTALQNWKPLSKSIWYDDFHEKIFTNWEAGERREWQDNDTLHLTRYMQDALKLPFADALIEKAVQLHAQDNKKNEPREWLNSLVWDGTERIANVLTDCYGASDSLYTMTASENFFIAMVARVMRPGCKYDQMLILEGKQGILKSSSLEVLAGPWFAELTEQVNSKDFFMCLQGKLILEISEMAAFNKAETERIKQIVSSPTDRYRPPYGRAAKDHPRQCVFVGTTNEQHYLKDNTGARRFWPVECRSIDLKQLAENREQYFAEAVSKFKAGASWWNMPLGETVQQQEDRRQTDSWEEVISKWLPDRNPTELLTAAYILNRCLEIEPAKQERRHSNRVGQAMRALGYRSKSAHDSEQNKTVRVYVKEEHHD